MDTLTASQELRKVGIPQEQADAIAQIIREMTSSKNGRSVHLTQSHLDRRLLQRTMTIIVAFVIVVGLFTLPG